MRVIHFLDPAQLALGAVVGVRMDFTAGILAQDGVPALVADVDDGAGVQRALDSQHASGSGWASDGAGGLQTAHAGDAATLVTSAYAVDVRCVQKTTGAICHVKVDGQPAPAFSTSTSGSPHRIYLDGQPHQVQLSYQGDATLDAALVGAATDTVLTGLAAALGVARNGQALQSATYTFIGQKTTTPHSVTVKQGGTTLGTIAVGQSSAVVPGLTISLSDAGWSDTAQAQVATTAPVLDVAGWTEYPNLLANTTYYSPILDSGQPGTAWPYLELAQGPVGATPPQVTLAVGDVPTPDPTWQTFPLQATVTPDPDGGAFQRVLYAVPQGGQGDSARGRYAQFQGKLVPAVRSWSTDLRVWHWRPQDDPFLGRISPDVYGGPTARAIQLANAAALADAENDADELFSSLDIGSATGQYLAQYGQQLKLPRLPGEASAAYRARLTALLATLGQGGTQPFLQRVLSGALGEGVVVAQYQKATSSWTLGQGALGTDTVLGTRATGYWRWYVQVPLAGLAIPPETAVQVVQQYRPVGSIVDVQFV